MVGTESSQSDPAQRLARTLGPLIVLGAGIAMAAWTWFKWPDPLVDFGRELYVPWQLGEGKVLYRDIAYFNGPLSPYFNSIVFRVLGVSLQSLVVVNLVILTAIVLMIRRLWVMIADHLAATLACVLFLTIFAFIQLGGIGNYNFVTPYSHELTHGIALSLGGMLCLASYLRKQRNGLLAGAGLMLGLIFLTKAEVFVAAAGSITCGLLAGLWLQRASPRRIVRALGQFTLSAVVPPIVALVLLAAAMPWSDALRGALGSWIYLFDPALHGMKFYRRILGTHDLANNLYSMFVGVVWWTAIFGVVAAVGLALRRITPRMQWWLFIVTLLIGGVGMWLIGRMEVLWDQAFRGLSPVMVVVTIGLVLAITKKGVRNLFGGRAAPGKKVPDPFLEKVPDPFLRLTLQFGVTLFALLMLGKMLLNVMLVHYGFALAMPAMLVMVALLASWWPGLIDRRGGSGVVLRGVTIAAVGFVIFTYLKYYSMLASDKPVLVGSGRDSFYADARMHAVDGRTFAMDHRGRAVNLALEVLSKLPASATLATVPEGTMINYLSRRANPTPYITLMPPEVVMFGQERILQAFQSNPPDYILFVEGSSSEDFGFVSFRKDYGRKIFEWIQQAYRPVSTPIEPSYPITLLERKR